MTTYYEMNSNFRNRREFPHCGIFGVESSQGANDKINAIDPVCKSAPVLAWRPGFYTKARVETSSAINDSNTELIIRVDNYTEIDVFKKDMWVGCTINCIEPFDNNNCRIIKSENIFKEVFKIIIAPQIHIVIDQLIQIVDYTQFERTYIRVPTCYDMGRYKYLYNESLNRAIEIKNIDLDTRSLRLVERSEGWALDHNYCIRDELPICVGTINDSPDTNMVNVYDFQLNDENIGDWIRMRSYDYMNNPYESWMRQIIKISGNTIIFNPPLESPAPGGYQVEILPFSYDNYYPVQQYDYPQLATPFLVSLEKLIVPNVEIKHGNLSSIKFITIEMNNIFEGRTIKNLINSNNPNNPNACWVAMIDKNSNVNDKNAKFLTLVCKDQQYLYLDFKNPLRITLRLDDGTIFEPVQTDTFAPVLSMPELNVTLFFCVNHVKKI